jgi:hypothetical protein
MWLMGNQLMKVELVFLHPLTPFITRNPNFLIGNFGKKNPPYGFFAPMSNLTKVPF